MKKNTCVFLQYTKKLLLILALMGANYSSMAADVISDDQIRRVAKIAKATGTTIVIVKERVTVTVKGAGKKVNKKVKKSVLKVMKSKGNSWQNSSSEEWQDLPAGNGYSNQAPPRYQTMGYTSAKHPPILE